MEAQDWATIISTILIVLGARDGIPRFGKWLTGASKRRRSEVDRMAKERDVERTRVRILREALSYHRRLLFEAPCVPRTDIPDYPELPKE
ncbi:hypothetical protein [Microbacterium sp. MPKO10]|uniref:hypothetical protein n=1 Tax=Microbacterium sp. MPKO10 TaxID=2989818 RepID=UPI0022358B6F|nr:hypothetical protein [Microbacterium sp. MPKO10]MCW4458197.1 hypothetical protein [Microbacterium sp. MPKO10]